MAREYRWGSCKLENDEHNDFRFLKQLLTDNISDILVRNTDQIEKRCIENSREIGEYLASSNSDIYPININHSQRSEGSHGSDMVK